MTNYREILRPHSLGLNKTEIAASYQCARNTVAATLQRAKSCGLQWPLPDEMSDKQLAERLFPASASKPVYKMPDYAYVHKELQRSGVTRIIQCDNLKTGVQKYGKDEIVLNKAYQELSEHYGTAILPARVRSPKGEAAVEGTVGIISTFILAARRNRQFLSLTELNEAIWDRLEAFNHKPFQKREGSRASSFAEERPFLRPLPPRPFELATWKVATVGPNYHISVERMNYSVPFEYIKQKVDVRLTTSPHDR